MTMRDGQPAGDADADGHEACLAIAIVHAQLIAADVLRGVEARASLVVLTLARVPPALLRADTRAAIHAVARAHGFTHVAIELADDVTSSPA